MLRDGLRWMIGVDIFSKLAVASSPHKMIAWRAVVGVHTAVVRVHRNNIQFHHDEVNVVYCFVVSFFDIHG